MKKDNRGITLTEMIVTFALVAIFMAAAVSVITSAVVTHSELTASMYAQSVGEMLLDKVTGELAGANAEKGHGIVISSRQQKEEELIESSAEFYDRERRKTTCKINNGLLTFHYPQEVVTDREGRTSIGEEEDWALEEKAYMGFRVTHMQIRRANEENILEITIQIKNLKTGYEYTTSRCTKCYNFNSQSDFNRIRENTV